MPQTIPLPAGRHQAIARVTPSRVDPATARPFTLDQELEPFGRWVGDPIWAPPLGSGRALADSMLKETRPFASKEKRWAALVEKHRSEFTQVREFELPRPSIRLPRGRFFVSVTERPGFDKIEEAVPACVQTRLDEFLAGPGRKHGVKVYYLKPLCIEVGDELVMTTREDLTRAIDKVRDEIFEEYAELAPVERTVQAMAAAVNLGLALPRRFAKFVVDRRQRQIDAYQARIEFERRKTALDAARMHRRLRTDGCTFDDMLALTNPLDRTDVIEQYSIEKKLSNAKRDQLVRMAAGSVPWFVTLSLSASYIASLCLTFTPPVVMCDPAFVAELPENPGVLLKIGHFDEVGGVMHIEI